METFMDEEKIDAVLIVIDAITTAIVTIIEAIK